MATLVNKSVRILIDSCFDSFFKDNNKDIAKQKAYEIVDLVLESNKDTSQSYATKEDIRKLENEIKETKLDLLKWIFVIQLTIASFIVAIIKLF